MNSSRTVESRAGFSVIELSIILVVLAFVLTNALLITEDKRTAGRTKDTHEKLDVIQKMLTQYLADKGHYPCPANGRALVNSAQYGVGLGTGTGTCQTSVENPALGIFRVADAGFANGFNDMVFGVLPTADLGLPTDDAIDQWGNRIGYGVMQRFTKEGNYAATMDGDIRILNEGGDLNTKTAYVLISYGANSIGAWPFAGGANAGRIPSRVGSTEPLTDTQKVNVDKQAYRVSELVNSEKQSYKDMEFENYDMTGKFDKEFFRAGKPDPNSEGNKMLFDDIVRWKIPERFYGEDTKVDGKPFSPEHISGLVLWLDAKYRSSITTASGFNTNNVKAWKDRTSVFNNVVENNAEAVSATQRPTYREPNPTSATKAAIKFSEGTNDVLSIADEPSLRMEKMTLFVAAKSTEGLSDTSFKTLISKKHSTANTIGWGLGTVDDENKFGFWLNDSNDNATRVKEEACNLSETKIFTVTFDPSISPNHNMFMYLGCTAADSKFVNITGSSFANNFIAYLGALNATGSNSFNGDIFEIVAYNHVMSNFDRETVVKYLKNRWGVDLNTTSECTATQQSCPANTGIGNECSTNGGCCSGQCSAGKCCLPVGYSDKGLKCAKDSDCCDGNAKCSAYGFCWLPPRV